jgi:hypothetical protein
MLRRFQVGVLLLATTSLVFATDVIDRIVANVNGHIILQSEWDEALAYEALTGGKQLQELTGADRKAGLDRLVDQELLQEQFHSPAEQSDTQYQPDEQTLKARIRDVRSQFAEAASDEGWHALLTSYGFTEETFQQRVVHQLEILHAVEDRIGPTLQVDNKSVEDYYNSTFLPQLRKSGAKEPPLAEVAPKIHELLVQQKLNDALKEFLQNLRDTSTIRLLVTSPSGSESR